MANNCFECKFKETAFSDLSKIKANMREVKDGFFVGCLIGNNDTILDFYQRNANLPTSEVQEEVSCFTKTKIAESLDRLIEKTDEILNKLQ